jgi:hypothetical protein
MKHSHLMYILDMLAHEIDVLFAPTPIGPPPRSDARSCPGQRVGEESGRGWAGQAAPCSLVVGL